MDTTNIEQVNQWLNEKALLEASKANLIASTIVGVKFYDANGVEIYTPGIDLSSDDADFGDTVTDFKADVIAEIDTQIGALDANIADTPCDPAP